MHIEIGAKQIFYLHLSKALVDMLTELAGTHYDSECRSSVQYGHFIYGWKNQIELQTSQPVVTSCTNRELQTCLKICENPMPLPTVFAEARNEFTKFGYAALRQATEDERFSRLVPVVLR